jgi:tetratricopeptide (TPR) repeat protein
VSRKAQQIGLLVVGLLLAGYFFYNGQIRSNNKNSMAALASVEMDLSANPDDSLGLKIINDELLNNGLTGINDSRDALAKANKTGDSYLYALAISKRAFQDNDVQMLVKTAIEIDSFRIVLEQDARTARLEKITELLLIRALKIDSVNIEALNTLALIKIYRQDKIMEGVQTLLKIVKLDSTNEDANYQLGLLAVKSGQTDKGIERFRKLVSLQPLKKEYHRQLAILYGQKGDTKNAEKHAVLAR